MREVIENWEGTDEDLLDELNRKQFKQTVGDGMVTLQMIQPATLGATLNYSLELVVEGLKQSDPPQGSYVEKFFKRLVESSAGVDLANDELRGQLTALLVGAGWDQSQIDAVLAHGAVYESYADRALLGRDAVQADIDETRALIAQEQAQVDFVTKWDTLHNTHLATVRDAFDNAGMPAALRAMADAWEAD